MRYVTLPVVDLRLSQLVLGTATLSQDDAQAAALLDAFFALGGNSIDTAHSYGRGASERTIGRWMQERGNRAAVTLIDKGCHPLRHDQPRVTPDAIRADLAESLERLQSDYIDLYLLHRDDEQMPVGPLIETLNEARAAGRIRAFGASNWRPERIVEANAYAAERGLAGFVISSSNLSLSRPKEPMWPGCLSIGGEDRDWHTATQFPLLSWSSQGGGFLTGRYTREDISDPDMVRVWYSDENFARLERAVELGKRRGASLLQIALAYVLSQPFPIAAIVGPASVAELRDSYPATEIALTADELAYLDLRA